MIATPLVLAWLEDLDTTTDPQTIGRLWRKDDDGGYCCLGRLCKVAIDKPQLSPIELVWDDTDEHEEIDIVFTDAAHADYYHPNAIFTAAITPGSYDVDYDRSAGQLPEPFLKAVGMTEVEQRTLYNLNDGERLSFKEIAHQVRAMCGMDAVA